MPSLTELISKLTHHTWEIYLVIITWLGYRFTKVFGRGIGWLVKKFTLLVVDSLADKGKEWFKDFIKPLIDNLKSLINKVDKKVDTAVIKIDEVEANVEDLKADIQLIKGKHPYLGEYQNIKETLIRGDNKGLEMLRQIYLKQLENAAKLKDSDKLTDSNIIELIKK